MSVTCGVCSGAVPDGAERKTHTALCAEVAIEAWKETAAQHLRNEEFYRERAEKAEARIAKLEAALRWYADGENYQRYITGYGIDVRFGDVMLDCGGRAKAALKEAP